MFLRFLPKIRLNVNTKRYVALLISVALAADNLWGIAPFSDCPPLSIPTGFYTQQAIPPTVASHTHPSLTDGPITVSSLESAISHLLNSQGLSRPDFFRLLGSTVLALFGFFTNILWGQSSTAPTPQDTLKAFTSSQRQALTFGKSDAYKNESVAGVFRALIEYSQAEFSRQPLPNASKPANFERQELQRVEEVQRKLWETLKTEAKDPEIQSFLNEPYSRMVFETFIFTRVPALAAKHGLYPKIELLFGVNRNNDVFLINPAPIFYEVQAIESPDLPDAQAKALEQSGATLHQRVFFGGILDQTLTPIDRSFEFAQGALALNAYQAIAQRSGLFYRQFLSQREDLLDKRESLPDGLYMTVDLEATIERMKNQQRSADNVALDFLRVQTLLLIRDLDPRQHQNLLLAINDRHEAGHLENYFDPERLLETKTTYPHGSSLNDYDDALRNQLIHDEIAVAVRQLRNSPAPLILEDLAGWALKKPELGRNNMIAEHQIAAQWVWQTLLGLLSQGRHARFRMRFVNDPQVGRIDQIKLQLLNLFHPQNAEAYEELIQALTQERIKHLNNRYHRNSRGPMEYKMPVDTPKPPAKKAAVKTVEVAA